jgi:Family of unknown function (DUF6878)
MTEDASTPKPKFDAIDLVTQMREFEALAATIHPANKLALFEALAAAGITVVNVEFDGCGDSGQIENMEVMAGDQIAKLPTTQIEIASVSWGSSDIHRQTMPTGEAVEALVYDLLTETHAGWENNDGAYGTFTFDVADHSSHVF